MFVFKRLFSNLNSVKPWDNIREHFLNGNITMKKLVTKIDLDLI